MIATKTKSTFLDILTPQNIVNTKNHRKITPASVNLSESHDEINEVETR